jgi:hypothetical protein
MDGLLPTALGSLFGDQLSPRGARCGVRLDSPGSMRLIGLVVVLTVSLIFALLAAVSSECAGQIIEKAPTPFARPEMYRYLGHHRGRDGDDRVSCVTGSARS